MFRKNGVRSALFVRNMWTSLTMKPVARNVGGSRACATSLSFPIPVSLSELNDNISFSYKFQNVVFRNHHQSQSTNGRKLYFNRGNLTGFWNMFRKNGVRSLLFVRNKESSTRCRANDTLVCHALTQCIISYIYKLVFRKNKTKY